MKKSYSIFLLPLFFMYALALTMVGTTSDGSMILSEESYLAKVNLEKNTMSINNILTMPMFPKVKAKTTIIQPSNPIAGKLTIGQTIDSYKVEYPENFAEQIYVSSTVNFWDRFIEQEIKLENSAEREEITIEVDLIPSETGTYFIFAPYKKDVNAKYLTISPSQNGERGNELIVLFEKFMPSYELLQEINARSNFIRVFSWNIKLGPKQRESILLRYSTGYFADESLFANITYKPSVSKQYLLNVDNDPLLTLSNQEEVSALIPQVEATATASDVLEKIKRDLDALPNTASSETTLASLSYDIKSILDKRDKGLNSLEKALLFREISRKKGIPAELHIGEKEENYYVWAKAYVGTTSFLYDPANKKGNYRELYVEPLLETCKDDLYTCPWAGGFKKDVLCLGGLCISVYILVAIFALVFIAFFVVLQYKTETIYRLFGIKKVGLLREDISEATFILTGKEFTPQNPLEEIVWEELRRRGGIFSRDEYEKISGFSSILIIGVLEQLLEQGIIKRG